MTLINHVQRIYQGKLTLLNEAQNHYKSYESLVEREKLLMKSRPFGSGFPITSLS